MKYIISIKTENTPGVLYRIADIFLKRKVNIETINAYAVKEEGISQIYISVDTVPENVEKITKQIDKVIEVLEVKYHNHL
jgi:acetolactate synthase I/III small subunit